MQTQKSSLLVGTHLPFYNNKKSLESKAEYELNLALMKNLLDKVCDLDVFIIGDFNADVFRKNDFDHRLIEFINQNDLISLDILCTQKIPYTFTNNYNGTYYIHHIDHSLLRNLNNKFLNIQCNVVNDVANLSDHLCTTIQFDMLSTNSKHNYLSNHLSNDDQTINLMKSTNLNFNNKLIADFYSKRINTNLENYNYSFNNINDLYKDLCNLIIKSHNEAVEFQLLILPPKLNKAKSNTVGIPFDLR